MDKISYLLVINIWLTKMNDVKPILKVTLFLNEPELISLPTVNWF